MLQINNKNCDRIKIKGVCPRCGSKLKIESWEYVGEPKTRQFYPVCTNKNCDEHYGYGNMIDYRFINHRTIKIEGLFD